MSAPKMKWWLIKQLFTSIFIFVNKFAVHMKNEVWIEHKEDTHWHMEISRRLRCRMATRQSNGAEWCIFQCTVPLLSGLCSVRSWWLSHTVGQILTSLRRLESQIIYKDNYTSHFSKCCWADFITWKKRRRKKKQRGDRQIFSVEQGAGHHSRRQSATVVYLN